MIRLNILQIKFMENVISNNNPDIDYDYKSKMFVKIVDNVKIYHELSCILKFTSNILLKIENNEVFFYGLDDNIIINKEIGSQDIKLCVNILKFLKKNKKINFDIYYFQDIILFLHENKNLLYHIYYPILK
eukprot:Lithocolla_globosa_v1_NODE_4592_length_1404_cov_5.340252.p2 type:complete len:131 gc:universal NODE_4592_length_1404_cov_5.340252:678-286(-)